MKGTNYTRISLSELPETLYHATSSEYLSSIRKNGLGIVEEPRRMYDYAQRTIYTEEINRGVFLANNKCLAYDIIDNSYIFWDKRVEYYNRAAEGPKIVVFSIKRTDLDPERIYQDPNYIDMEDGDMCYFYDGIIPFEKLSIVDNPSTTVPEKAENQISDDSKGRIGDLYYFQKTPIGVTVIEETVDVPQVIMSLTSFNREGEACCQEAFLTADEACTAVQRFNTKGTAPGDWFLPSIQICLLMGAQMITRSPLFIANRDTINLRLRQATGVSSTLLDIRFHYWTSTRYRNARITNNLLMNAGGTSTASNNTLNCVRAMMVIDPEHRHPDFVEKLGLKETYHIKYTTFYARTPGCVLCICGGSNSGKSTLAGRLRDSGTVVLDGDALRRNINSDLNYGSDDCMKGCHRTANVAEYLSLQGFNVIVSTVRANYVYDILRDKIRSLALVSLWQKDENVLCNLVGSDGKEYIIEKNESGNSLYNIRCTTDGDLKIGLSIHDIAMLPEFAKNNHLLKKYISYAADI